VCVVKADAQRQRWADEFDQEPANQWANDFERTQTGATASVSGTDQQADAAATRGDTKALADLLSNDANPKMKNSKFLQFVSKMSRGEIILEDNQVRLKPTQSRSANRIPAFTAEQSIIRICCKFMPIHYTCVVCCGKCTRAPGYRICQTEAEVWQIMQTCLFLLCLFYQWCAPT